MIHSFHICISNLSFVSQLPVDFQGRVEKHDHGRNVTPRRSCSDSTSIGIAGKVAEKLDLEKNCLVTPSFSPQAQDSEFLWDKRQQRKSCDLYRSDTALYCRSDRWPERRQSVDLQNNAEDETLHLNFCPFRGFVVESLPVTGSYSSFSAASEEEEGHLTSCQRLWRNYECENTFSHEKDSPGLPQSESFHHVGHGSQTVSLPKSCYGASYRLTGGHGFSEDKATARQRKMGMEDVKTFSLPSSGPFICSEQNFTTTPTKLKLGSLYRSIQDKDDVFHTRVLNPRFSASTGSSPVLNPKTSPNVFRAEAFRFTDGSQSSSGNFEEEQRQTEDQNDINESPKSSSESLNQSLEAFMVYKKDLRIHPGAQKNTQEPQKCVNTRLSRKDSLTKAQLYGTLLN